MRQAFELWFDPEIERRRSAGTLGDDFVLMIAQVVFPIGEGQPTIRLNSEIRGSMIIQASRPVQTGEQVTLADLAGVQGFELADDELDHGHFTVIRRGESNDWMLCFNAFVGRKKAANLLRLAGEFLTTAKDAIGRSHTGPAIDNLLSCCELVAKAELMMVRSAAADSKKHGPIRSEINRWGHLGNAPSQFVTLMNRLANQRSSARYEGTAVASETPTEQEVEIVQSYLDSVMRRSSAKLGLP